MVGSIAKEYMGSVFCNILFSQQDLSFDSVVSISLGAQASLL